MVSFIKNPFPVQEGLWFVGKAAILTFFILVLNIGVYI